MENLEKDNLIAQELEQNNIVVEDPDSFEVQPIEDGDLTNTDLFDDTFDATPTDEKGEEVQSFADKDVMTFLKKIGFIQEDIEIPENPSSEDLENILNKAQEARMESQIEALSPALKGLIRLELNGGDINDFLKGMPENKPTTTEEQLVFARNYLKSSGLDEEDVDVQLEGYKNNPEKLKSFVEKTQKKLEQNNAAKIEQEKELIKKQQEELIRKEKEYKTSLSTALAETVFAKNDKTLPNYLIDKSFQLANGQTISAFYKDIFYELPKNPKALLDFTYLIKNRNKDGSLNLEAISKVIKTDLTKKIDNNIQRKKENAPTNSKDAFGLTKSIAEYF